VANKARTLTAAALIAIAATCGTARGADLSRPLVLYVYDYAHVPASTLVEAEREATRIYQAAGVSVAWVPVSDTSQKAWSRHLQVVFLSREMSAQKIELDNVGPRTMGQASRSAGRAYVFYDRAVEQAHRYAPNVATMIGWVIAHEVGHLLLPESGHSDVGIMRGTFDRLCHEQRFTDAQSRSLQLSLVAPVTIAAQ
jgi:hypothetical protein